MSLVDRVKNILLTPKTEWDVVAGETTAGPALVTGYVLPLAAVSAIAGFIGAVLIGVSMPFAGTVRVGMTFGLVTAIIQIVMAVVMVYVVGFVIDFLAPTFGGQKNFPQALKVAIYAYTPVWVAGVLKIIPMLGILVLLAALYAFYLLYLGLPRLMRSPPEKAAGYTVVVVIASIVLAIIIGVVSGAVLHFGMPGAGMGALSGLAGRHGGEVTYDANSPLGKLDAFSKKMEEANRNMEEAKKSGDAGKQTQAAMAALGTVLSGGKGVEPVQLDQLKPLLPETLAGLPRTDMRTDRSGVKGLMIAKAEAVYGGANGAPRIDLAVTDTGGAAGLMGLAAWMGLQGEHEDSNRREVTSHEGNRLVHEEVNKHGGTNKFTVVVAERFIVEASGRNVPIDTLKSSVSAVDLSKLEGLK